MSKKILIVFLLFLSISSWSQNNGTGVVDSTSVSDKETVSFEMYYYEALKEKVKGNFVGAVELLRKSLRFQPNNADVQYEVSINYKSLKDYKQAILYGENAVRFNPNQKWYWVNIAELYNLVGDTKNTERCYAKLSDLDSKFVPEYIRSIARTGDSKLALNKVNLFLKNKETEELLVLKRDLLVVNNQQEEAIALTERLIEIDPNNSSYYYEVSELLLKEGKVKDAEKYISLGLQNTPDSPVLLRQDFKVLMQKQDFDAVFDVLKVVFANHRFNFNDKLGFVIEFVKVDTEHKETSRLIDALEVWVDDTHEVKVYPIIGNLYRTEGNKEKALSSFRKGFEAGYKDFSGLIDMLVLEQELGEYSLLSNDSERVIELYPSQPLLFLFRGFALNQLGYYGSSIDVLEQGLEYVMNNDKLKAEFHSMIADGYYRQKHLEKCFAEFDKAIGYDAENIVVLNNYSFYLAENNIHLDKALQMIQQVLETESNNSTYLDTMAWVYYKQGNYDNAKKSLQEALKNGGGSSSDILEHYGDVLYKLDKVSQAVKQWKKAYKLNNSSSELKEKIEKRAIQ